MAQEKEEILIEIVVSNEAAAKTIFENQQSIERLKQTQIELTKARKEGTITEEEYSKKSTAVKVAIDSQKESIRQNEKELRNNIKSQKENTDSLAAMRAQLSNSVKEFDNLSKAERESARGQELQKSIADTVEQLNEAEQATGRFQRQIGNYPEGMGKAGQGINQVTGFLGKMSDQVSVVSPKLGGMISSFGGFAAKASGVSESVADMSSNISQSGEAMGSIEGFAGKASGSLDNLATTSGTAAKASTGAFSSIASGARALGTVFLTPPIIIIAAVVGAIVAAFALLKKGFNQNDEAADKLENAMSILQPIFHAVGELASFLANAIGTLVEFMADGIATIVDFTAGLFGIETGMSAAAQEAKNLLQAERDLEDAETEFIVTAADRALKKSKLLADVANKEKFTAEQRIALLKDANALDLKDLEDKKKFADESLRIIEAKAKAENKATHEVELEIANARARQLNTEREYFDGLKDLNKKLAAAENELAAEQKANYEKWKQIHDEKLSKEKAAIRQLEDLVIQQIKDDFQRQIQAEETKTKRANEDLLIRLNTEKNLTAKARQAISDAIIENNNILNDKVNELTEKSLEENIKKEIDAKTKENEAKLQLAEKGSQEELNIKIAKLTLQRDAQLSNDNLTNVERLAIEDKYNKDSQALNDSYLISREQRLMESFDKEFKLRILNAENNNIALEEQKAIELESAILEAENLKNLDAETKAALYQTQLDYEIAIAESQKKIIIAQENVTAAQLTSLVSFNAAMTSISQSIGTIISNLAEDSYEAAQFQRALAIFNIGIALSESIAGVTKMAATKSVTVFDMLATILAGTASVASSIAGAKKAFNESPMPKKPAFAFGGLVSGPGSGTSDSIDAKLSNGESVLNANSTAMFSPLLSALNQAGGGVGFGQQQVSNQLQGEEMLARAFAKGASMIPPNVLTLKEFHAANDRYVSLKEL
jgi:hypothetical protein